MLDIFRMALADGISTCPEKFREADYLRPMSRIVDLHAIGGRRRKTESLFSVHLHLSSSLSSIGKLDIQLLEQTVQCRFL